jgi:hypothetical protein
MFSLPTIVIPIWALFIPFGLIVFLFLLYSFFNIYHLLRFATYSMGSYLTTVIFVGGSVIIMAVAWAYIVSYDWTLAWNLSDFLEFKSSFL